MGHMRSFELTERLYMIQHLLVQMNIMRIKNTMINLNTLYY